MSGNVDVSDWMLSPTQVAANKRQANNDAGNFLFILHAPSSRIMRNCNTETITYLNKGENYELRLKYECDRHWLRSAFRSTLQLSFHERRMQVAEKSHWRAWQAANPTFRAMDIDSTFSSGIRNVSFDAHTPNAVDFDWDSHCSPILVIRFNVLSSEFTVHKRGGERGAPFDLQVGVYTQQLKMHIHTAACCMKVFRGKGAERKLRFDSEREGSSRQRASMTVLVPFAGNTSAGSDTESTVDLQLADARAGASEAISFDSLLRGRNDGSPFDLDDDGCSFELVCEGEASRAAEAVMAAMEDSSGDSQQENASIVQQSENTGTSDCASIIVWQATTQGGKNFRLCGSAKILDDSSLFFSKSESSRGAGSQSCIYGPTSSSKCNLLNDSVVTQAGSRRLECSAASGARLVSMNGTNGKPSSTTTQSDSGNSLMSSKRVRTSYLATSESENEFLSPSTYLNSHSVSLRSVTSEPEPGTCGHVVSELCNFGGESSSSSESPFSRRNVESAQVEFSSSERTSQTASTGEDSNDSSTESLTQSSSAEHARRWLRRKRFLLCLSALANFDGADLLRASRADLIDLCGRSDGIRLFNALAACGRSRAHAQTQTAAPAAASALAAQGAAGFLLVCEDALATPAIVDELMLHTVCLRSGDSAASRWQLVRVASDVRTTKDRKKHDDFVATNAASADEDANGENGSTSCAQSAPVELLMFANGSSSTKVEDDTCARQESPCTLLRLNSL